MMKKKDVYIRADANPIVGIGHIMRCLSIADAFLRKGISVHFVLADEQAVSMVSERGFEAYTLHSDYSRMGDEVKKWPEIETNLIIVDSYYATDQFFMGLKKKMGIPGKIVYIDDLVTFFYPVDVLVNYNAYAREDDYRSGYFSELYDEPTYFCGLEYVPLRSMFADLPPKIQNKTVEDVLISTGGADDLHLALKFVESGLTGYRFHILLGAMNTDKGDIYRVTTGCGNIILHDNVSEMRSLIEGMDIVVSAAGSTMYEICACGVPMVTYVVADNQILGANAFEERGLAVNVGDIREVENPVELLLVAIDDLAKDYNKRVMMGMQMQRIVDGHGADRLVEKLKEIL